MIRFRRLLLAAALGVLGLPFAGGAPSAFAATLNVCSTCTYTSIQAALVAAANGDTIDVGPGTYYGPLNVTKSVNISGAGAESTIIKGGSNGPVVTIGVLLASTEPTVNVSGVTITDGVNVGVGFASGQALGGGVWIVPAAGDTLGGTVTITRSAITGNHVSPGTPSQCGGFTCASGSGGGIYNDGNLTLIDTSVSNNSASANADPATGAGLARGGGIASAGFSTLILRGSTVSGNTAVVTQTNNTPLGFGINAAGGGILSFGGPAGALTIDDSTISGNRVTVSTTSTDPGSDVSTTGGGILVTGVGTIRNSQITHNRVNATAYGGIANANAGGMVAFGTLALTSSSVSDNSAGSTITSTLASANSFSDAGGLEVDGSATIQKVQFTGNRVTGQSPAATAQDSGTNPVGGGLVVTAQNPSTPTTVTQSVIAGNSVVATTSTGLVTPWGGGIFNCSSTLTLTQSLVLNNSATANGPTGTAQGGGIWNGNICNGPTTLTLNNTLVLHNSLTASSPNVARQGGGLYTTDPVSRTATAIAANSPDQCFGC